MQRIELAVSPGNAGQLPDKLTVAVLPPGEDPGPDEPLPEWSFLWCVVSDCAGVFEQRRSRR